MSLDVALGAMRSLRQWFIWRLEWDESAGKYQKTPCALDGSVYRVDASLPSNWHDYHAAVSAAVFLNASDACIGRTLHYALGFWLTEECGYWFFDLDKVSTGDGVLSEFAAQMVAAFPSALMEWSSSRKGIHIIGRGAVGPHRSRDVHKLGLEFYTSGRGIAFGLDGQAQGSADADYSAQVQALVDAYFPPRAVGDAGEGARAEWRGPVDDEVLIAKMLSARISAGAAFGGKLSLAQLWAGDVPEDQRSNADMALASHLAFWTGCDEDRMERLMWRSGLVREKWREHRTYLRQLTIANACKDCVRVYQEPERSVVAQQEAYGLPGLQQATATTLMSVGGPAHAVITPEMAALVKSLMDRITACGTMEEMHNEIIPAVRAAQVPGAYTEQLAKAINSVLDFHHAKMPIARLRALINPPVVAGTAGGNDAPLWLQQHCYVKDGDFFYNCENGARMTNQGFIAEYARLMPMKDNGQRENPVEWAFTRWNITTVHRLGYRPDMGPYYEWDGLDYANLYNIKSVPDYATEWTEDGLAAIDATKRLMWDMCGRREDVYLNLLQWMAHNVQRPSIKIRWAPIIKGCMGDGKSLLMAVLRAAMGYRNVKITGNSTLTNSGGFNQWAIGAAVNVIEEIMLTGKERHRIYNAMNEFITNSVVNINAKGKADYTEYNCTNHIALTNHNDALPLGMTDRRWFVIFTPWMTLQEMQAYCGLDAESWKGRTGLIDRAIRELPGELRSWLLGVQIDAGFDIRGSAMVTPEKMRMMATSNDDAAGAAESIIMEGAAGITRNVLSSSCLSALLRLRAQQEGFEVPRSTALNHMLTQMGYSKLPKQIKWRGQTHTMWVRNGFTEEPEGLRLELETNRKPNLKPQ